MTGTTLAVLALAAVASPPPADPPGGAPTPPPAATAQEPRSPAPPSGEAAASRPVLEQRVYLRALETFALSDDERARIAEARDAFLERQEAMRREISTRMKELMDSRRSAPSSEPPSPEFRKAMEELRGRQLRVAELQRAVDAILGPDRAAELREHFDDALARTRRELAEKAELERKAREARQRAAAGAPPVKRPAAPEAPE